MSNAAGAPLMLSVSGCRGIVGKTMTPEVAARFGMVVGAFFVEKANASTRPLVVLGRDGRAGGDVFARAAAAGLVGAGCDVLDCGVAMTPTIGVMVDARRAAGALIVTASHNPQEWNGLKIVAGSTRDEVRSTKGEGGAGAAAPSKSVADEIIARYRAAEKSGASGVDVARLGSVSVSPAGGEKALGFASEATNIHVERVREALKAIGCVEDRRWQAIKCVVDSVNASGTSGAKALLGDRIVHHLGSSDSGLFPHTPEPTRENLTMLARFTAEKRADVGFAQDPDADRLAIIDEKGSYIGEEYTLALAAEAVLGAPALRAGRGSDVVCVNLSTSRMIEDVAARHGARVVRTAVGEANVVEAMRRENAVFGGEGNGGVIWPRVTYIRDSLSAMGLVLALMTRTGKTISQLVADIPSYAIVKRKVDVRGPEDAKRTVEAVAARYAKDAGAKVDRQDGVWVGLEAKRAWLHVRGSNAEPIMRLIAEAPTEAEANAILNDATRAIG